MFQNINNVQLPTKFSNRIKFRHNELTKLINGDGLVLGQQFTLSAPRGSGKTTFLLQLEQSLVENNPGLKVGYISSEEAVVQIAANGMRVGATQVQVASMTDIDDIAKIMAQFNVLVIDSVDCLDTLQVTGKGRKADYACDVLIAAARKANTAVFYIQHMTKGGVEKGSVKWGHMVDTVLYVRRTKNDTTSPFRSLEVDKNRFGPTGEFHWQMTGKGWDFTEVVLPPVLSNKEQQEAKDIEFILAKLSIKPCGFPEFAELDVVRLAKVLKRLEMSKKVLVIGKGNDRIWSLPKTKGYANALWSCLSALLPN